MVDVLSHEHPDEVVSSCVAKKYCPYCGREGDLFSGMEREVVRCDECGTMIARGVAQPLLTINPHPDASFVMVRIERIQSADVFGDIGCDKHGPDHYVVNLKLAKEFASLFGRALFGEASL
jgi:ribosomal protein L37AE/L43A